MSTSTGPTLRPATQARIDRVVSAALNDTSPERSIVREAVLGVLREHARDTRHACAEAVAALRTDLWATPGFQHAAQQACMNAHAV